MKKTILSIVLLAIFGLTSCSSDDDSVNPNNGNPDELQTRTFRLTLKNAINYLNVKRIGDGPLTNTGDTFEVSS